MKELPGTEIVVKMWTSERVLESAAEQQLRNVAKLPVVGPNAPTDLSEQARSGAGPGDVT